MEPRESEYEAVVTTPADMGLADDPEPENLNWLLGTTDAMVWATEFCKLVREGKDASDEGWLVGWFANAMAAQETKVQPASQTTRALLDELERRIPVDKLGPLHTLRSQIGPAFLDKTYLEIFLMQEHGDG